MTDRELFDILEMDSSEDFSYFEQFAELVENEGEIGKDQIETVISAIDGDDLAELVSNYFDDFSNAAPDDDDDLISLLETVRQSLMMLAQNFGDKQSRSDFADRLSYFRAWIHRKDGALIDGKASSVFDAVAFHRGERIGEAKHKYEFVSCGDYELDDLSLNLGSYSKVDILGNDNGESDDEN